MPQVDDNEQSAPRPLWPAILFGLFGFALLSVTCIPFATARGWIDASAYDGSADPYTTQLHSRLQWAGGVMGAVLVIAAIGWKLAPSALVAVPLRWMTRVRHDATVSVRELITFLRSEWLWLLVVAAVALAMRLLWIERPLRFDEAISWLDYASQPLYVTVAKYDQPNNHVFQNVCMAIAIRCFGSTVWAIRLTALVAGVLTCVLAGGLTFSLARPNCDDSRWPRFAGLLSGLCIAVSSAQIEYSTLGRGYTLIGCLSLVCWIAAREAALSRNVFLFLVAILAAALGLWTVPVMLYPMQMIVCLLLWDPEMRGQSLVANSRQPIDRRQLWRGIIAGGAAACGLAGLLYLPALLVGGASSIAGNTYVSPLSIGDWASQWFGIVLRGMALIWRDVPIPIRCFWIFGIVGLATRPDRWQPRFWLAMALVLPVFLMPLLQRVHPPSRVWLYVIPALAVLSASGWCGRLRAIRSPKWRTVLAAILVAGMVIGTGLNVLLRNSIARSTESGLATAAREAAEFLQSELQPAEPIIAVCPASAPLRYYADRVGIDWKHFDLPASDNTRDDTAVVVVSKEGEFDQSVDSVLAELRLTDQFQNWSRREIWSRPGLTLYRLTRP